MFIYRFWLLAVIVGFALFAAVTGFGQEDNTPKKSAFQQTADSFLGGCGLQMVEYGHFPHFQSWRRLKETDSDAELQKRYESFPGDLIVAVGDRENSDHEAAIVFLAKYASFARMHAAQLSEKDLPLAVDRALAPHTAELTAALVESLKDKAASTRLMAALTILCLDESHAKANESLRASAKESKSLVETCRSIGFARLTSPQALELLRRQLKHHDPDERESAALAITNMGPAARSLISDLIAYIETGDDAKLALAALAGLKEHAATAVPTILARFPKANDEDQLAMLAALAHIGCRDVASIALVRKSLESDKSRLKLMAASALLHLVPDHRKATGLLRDALANPATMQTVIETCIALGPPSREIGASLAPLLNDDDENVRINTMRAMASIGPYAANAVPGIEKLLSKNEDGMTHTFLSTRAAAFALAKIRGKEATRALMRVAESRSSGAHYAILYLPDLGDDLPPSALASLVRIAENRERTKFVAALALSNLGERARPVRRDLERLLDDPAIGWVLDTALRRIHGQQSP